jgi:hypothetical protein
VQIILASGLGGIHGDIGMAQQGLLIQPVARVQCHAHAGADIAALRLQLHWLAGAQPDALQQVARPASLSRSFRISTNSSPPSRATVSSLRMLPAMRSATIFSNWSPAACPGCH